MATAFFRMVLAARLASDTVTRPLQQTACVTPPPAAPPWEDRGEGGGLIKRETWVNNDQPALTRTIQGTLYHFTRRPAVCTAATGSQQGKVWGVFFRQHHRHLHLFNDVY